MEDLEMQEAFLGYLYNVNFGDEDSGLDKIDKWVKSSKMDRTTFWKQYEMMIKSDLLKFSQDEAVVRLTPKGTLHAEKSGLAPTEKIAENRDIRKRLMYAMAAYLTRKGASIAIKDLVREAKLKDVSYEGNIHLLVEMGYARWQIPAEQLLISAKVCSKVAPSHRAA